MKRITAKTSLKNYPIFIEKGIFEKIPEYLSKYFDDSQKTIFLTNDTLQDLYSNRIKWILSNTKNKSKIITIKDGEEYKNLNTLTYIYDKLLEFNTHRDDIIIAFGGGVIGDICGFTAATFNRGINLIHIPTTIISQVDSSIGGKTAVNFKKIKNIIGCFYHPEMVFIDPLLLETLEERQIINGIGEMVKYGIIFDKRILKAFKENIEENDNSRLLKIAGKDWFLELIYRSCDIKTMVVRKDEFDIGYRNLLNFGHTVGHCIENAFDLREINHGQAVGLGMIVAINISIDLGLIDKKVKRDIVGLYKILKLPYRIPEIDTSKIINALKYDKKFTAGQNKFILIKGINKPFLYSNTEKSIILDNIKKSM